MESNKFDEIITRELEVDNEAEMWKNKYYYLAADFDTFKRNNAKRLADSEKFKSKDLIIKLLDLVDNFERSFKFDDSYLPLYNQLMKIINDEGAEIIQVNVGDKFDENIMNAISTVQNEEIAKGSIYSVIKNGYKYKGEIIRFVDVIVNV